MLLPRLQTVEKNIKQKKRSVTAIIQAIEQNFQPKGAMRRVHPLSGFPQQ